MYRIRNEARWIRRSLERTFEVASTVVLLDDGSTDDTILESVRTFWGVPPDTLLRPISDSEMVITLQRLEKTLHVLRSPFRKDPTRSREVVNEIRDKNFLWWFCKARVDFTHMLCLDGDEMLSRKALERWPTAIAALQADVDFVHLPFIYLWDSETLRRVDGIYGDAQPDIAKLNFPRLFTIARVNDDDLFDTMFKWEGTKGGFHCGSIPRQGFKRSDGVGPTSTVLPLPVVHFGYIDDSLRRAKFEFYNRIDPGNTFEGEYKHIIGEPDVHAPGPVQLVEWRDE